MQVPPRDAGLARVGIATLVVAVVADVHRVEAIEKAERPVVDRQPQDRQVVGVHHAVAKTHRLPLRHQPRGASRHLLQPRQQRYRRVAAFGMKTIDHRLDQPAQRGHVVGRVCEVLEMPEAQEARRDPRHHGRGLDVLAHHRRRRADDGQCPRRRDAQVMHRLRAQELANRRAQHGAAIAHARVRREAAALELDFLPADRAVDLAQQQRTTIAQLAGPDAELVAAVDAGQRRAPCAVALPDSTCSARSLRSQSDRPSSAASASLRATQCTSGSGCAGSSVQ